MKVSKKIMSLLIVSVISIGIVGCSSEQPKKEATGNDTTKQEKQVNEKSTDTTNKGTVYTVNGASTTDGNVEQTVLEVSVFDNMLDAVKSYGQNEIVVNDENKDKTTVVLKMKIKNNNEFAINTYPCQGTIITNTGEQKDADIIASESFDGEIFEGVESEGHVLFNLDKTTPEQLESFKFAFTSNNDNGTSENYDDDYHGEHKLEINLK